MRDVTQSEFYAALSADKRDIMPVIVGRWSDETGYVEEWRTNDYRRDLFGKSWGVGLERHYQLFTTPEADHAE
jgi:hypothetical protein